MRRAPVLLALLLGGVLATAGCGNDEPELVIYNGQHEQLLDELAPLFTEQTGHQGRAAQRQRPRALQPAGPGGEQVTGRRVPHRELPGDVAVEQAGPLREAPAGAWPRPDPRAVPPDQRPVDRLRRPLDGAGLQQAADPTCAAADVDHGPRRPEVDGQGLLLARPAPTSRRSSRRCSTSRARPRPRPGSTASRPTARCTTATTWCSRRSTPASPRSGSSTTTTGTATRRSPATTATTARSTSSATRTRARSSASPAPACWTPSDMKAEAEEFVAFLTSEEGQQALAASYALEYPLNPAATLGPAGQAVRRARAPAGERLATSTSQKVVDLLTQVGLPLSALTAPARRRTSSSRPPRGRCAPRPARRRAAGRCHQPRSRWATSSSPPPSSASDEAMDFLLAAADRRPALEHHPAAGRRRGARPSSSASAVPGWSTAPTCPASTGGTACCARRSPCRRSSTATAGSPPRTPSSATRAPCWS